MALRNKEKRPGMNWQVMDCRDLSYESSFFDLIIDKSTIDALLCGENAYTNVAMMLKECQRVLKTDGYYVAISYGSPKVRELHFKQEMLGWKLKTFKIEKTDNKSGCKSYHFIISLKKYYIYL